MANCDVCGVITSTRTSPTYAAPEFRRLVGRGYTPDPAALDRAVTSGVVTAREALVPQWQKKVAEKQTDWLLCRDCAARVADYRFKGKARNPRWWLPWAIGIVVVIIAIIAIVIISAPKSQARSLGGYDLGNAIITSFAFSPDGQFLAAGDGEKRVRVWNVKEERVTATLTGHLSPITGVAYSPDGQWIAYAYSQSIWIMDTHGGRQRKVTTGEGVWDVGPHWARRADGT